MTIKRWKGGEGEGERGKEGKKREGDWGERERREREREIEEKEEWPDSQTDRVPECKTSGERTDGRTAIRTGSFRGGRGPPYETFTRVL